MIKRIKNNVSYYKRYFLIGSFVISVSFLIFSIYSTFKITSMSNDECLWVPNKLDNDSLSIVIREVKKGGIADNAGIKDGDYLLEIAGKKVRTTMDAAKIFNSFAAGDTVDYKILQSGEIKTVKMTVKKFVNFSYLANSLLAFFWLLVGFTVVMSKPDGKLQMYFYLIGISFSFQSFMGQFVWIRAYQEISAIDVFLEGIEVTLVSFVPYWFIMFFSSFPRESTLHKKRWFKPVFFYISIISIIISSIAFLSQVGDRKFSEINMGGINVFVQIYYRFGIFTGLVFLIISYIKIKSSEKRKEVLLILLAYILLILTIIYAQFIAPTFSGPIFNSPEIYLPIFLIALFPIAFGVSIYKYHLLDFSVVIKNTIIYGAATLLFAAIYFLSIYGLGISVGTVFAEDYKNIVIAISFVLFAFVFQSTKEKFQEVLTKRFYPEEFSQQRILIEFNRELAKIVGVENILERIKHTFVHTLKIEKFGIMLRSEGKKLVMVNSVGLMNKDIVIKEEEIKAFLENKFRQGDDVVLEQHNFEVTIPEVSGKLAEDGIYTIIPMIIKSEVVGLLLFGLKHSGRQFSGKDIELLNAVSTQSAVSIENARLYLAEAEKVKYDREMELAYKIQQNLLPKEIPEFDELDIYGKMIPAQHVGGDYYDIIPVGRKKLFIAVGDVSGKGVSASFYMAKLQTLLQYMCSETKEPKELIEDLNQKMLDVIDRESFITLNLGLIDLVTMKMKYCRAGHLPMYISDGTHLREYKPEGIGLGICRNSVFSSHTEQIEIDLQSGSTVVFFSDGITETMNSKKEFYDEDRLKEIILKETNKDSEALFNSIYDSVLRFRGGEVQADDITGLIIKIK